MWMHLRPSWFPFLFLFSHLLSPEGSGSALPDSGDSELPDSPWRLTEQESDPLSVTSDLGVWLNSAAVEDAAFPEEEAARIAGLDDEHLGYSSKNVGLVKRQGNHRPRRALPLVLVPAAGALLALVGALFAKHVSKKRELARARARLHELNVPDDETWRLQKLKRGRFIHDSHAELYLSNLQDRLETGDEQLYGLDNKQLRQCAAARFLLFPLKLPLRLSTDNHSGHSPSIVEEHYALGVIDRQHRLLRIVDSCKREKELYELPLQHLKDLAKDLDLQLRDGGLIAGASVRCIDSSACS
ncbi:hypothetical protein Emag_000275 [Eimeria magna]